MSGLLLIAVEEAQHLFDIADADRDLHRYGTPEWHRASEIASAAFVNMVRAERFYFAETGIVI